MRLGLGMRLSDILKGGAAPVVPKSTLVDGLVSYWSLDETSGTRADAVGDNDLTDNNTVGYDTGKNGNAASFLSANTESLSLTPPATFFPEALTVAAWLNLRTAPAGGVNTIANQNSGFKGWWITNYYGLGYYFGAYTDDGGVDQAGDIGLVDVTNQWHLVIAGYDGSSVFCQVDNRAENTAAFDGTAWSYGHTFKIGLGLDTYVDEVAIWSRVLTSDERAELYNSGNGKFYNATSEDFEE